MNGHRGKVWVPVFVISYATELGRKKNLRGRNNELMVVALRWRLAVIL